MVLAIHIWLKLKKSIPLRYRAHYSLLPDPAAGNVAVVARTPSLELPGLWSTKAGRNDLGKVWSLRRNPTLPTLADHVAFIPLTPALPVVITSRLVTNDNSTLMSTRSFNIARQKFLGRTWMALAGRCDWVLGSPQDDENAYGTRLEREEDDEVRFSVEGDMNANATTPLRMNWAQLVWLSLALGVRPHDSAWNENYPLTLRDSEGNALITLFESDGQIFARVFTERDISYSLSRAFAWHNIILEKEGLWPLGWQFESHVRLSSVQISPGLSVPLDTEDLAHGAKNVLRGKEAQDCEDPLASACRWMLYHRRHRSVTGDSLPVSQQMLEFREQTLCHLHLLEKEGRLEERIRDLLRAPLEPQDRVTTGDEKIAKDDSRRDMVDHASGTQNEHMPIDGTSARVQTNEVAGSAISAHEVKQDISTRDEKPGLDQQGSGGEIVDDRNAIPSSDGSQGRTKVLASATHDMPMSAIGSDSGHTDSANGQDLHPQPANAIIHSQSTGLITESSSCLEPTKDELSA